MWKLAVYIQSKHIQSSNQCQVFEFRTRRAAEAAKKWFMRDGCWPEIIKDHEDTDPLNGR